MRAVILAAGFGTRMRGLSKIVPKPLLPLGEHKLIDYALSLSISLRLEPLVVLGFGSSKIKKHLKEKWPDVDFLVTENKTGDLMLSLKSAEKYVDGDFVWMGADTIFLDKSKIREMIETKSKKRRFGLLYCESMDFSPKVTLGKGNEVIRFDITNEPISKFSSPTLYLSSPEIFDFIGKGNRDIINKLIESPKWHVFGVCYKTSDVLEANDPEGYYRMHRNMFKKSFTLNSEIKNSKIRASYVYDSTIVNSEINSSIIMNTSCFGKKISGKLIWGSKHEDKLRLCDQL